MKKTTSRSNHSSGLAFNPWRAIDSSLKKTILSDIDGIKEYRDRSKSQDYYSEYIAEKYGVYINRDHLRAALSNYRKHTGIYYPQSIKQLANKHLQLSGNWVVTSDWHIPYVDLDFMEIMLKTVDKVHPGIKNIMLVGDFLDNTMYKFFLDKFETGIVSEDEFGMAEKILTKLSQVFEQVVWMPGNHEARFFRKVDNKIDFSRFAKMISPADNVTLTPYSFVVLNNKWRITHPKSYSRIPTRIANQLSLKHRQSVISAHGHRFGLNFDDSGKEIVIDSGGMFDPGRLDYINYEDSNYPQWNQGFIVIQNNFPYLYAPGLTDWKKLGIKT